MLYTMSCVMVCSGPYNKPGINLDVCVSVCISTLDTVTESSRHSKMQEWSVSGCCDGWERDALKDPAGPVERGPRREAKGQMSHYFSAHTCKNT